MHFNKTVISFFLAATFVSASNFAVDVIDLSTANQPLDEVVQADAGAQSSGTMANETEKKFQRRMPKTRKKRPFWVELKSLLSGLAWLGLGVLTCAIATVPAMIAVSAVALGLLGLPVSVVVGACVSAAVLSFGIYKFSGALYNQSVKSELESLRVKLSTEGCSLLDRKNYENKMFVNNVRKFVGKGLMAGTWINILYVCMFLNLMVPAVIY